MFLYKCAPKWECDQWAWPIKSMAGIPQNSNLAPHSRASWHDSNIGHFLLSACAQKNRSTFQTNHFHIKSIFFCSPLPSQQVTQTGWMTLRRVDITTSRNANTDEAILSASTKGVATDTLFQLSTDSHKWWMTQLSVRRKQVCLFFFCRHSYITS